MKKALLPLVFMIILTFILSGCAVKQTLKLTAAPLNATSIKLSWNGPKGDFILYRSTTKENNFFEIGEATLTSYIDKGLTPNTTYYYKIKEKSKSGFSKVSNIASSTTFERIPKAPVLSIISSSTRTVVLSWKEKSNEHLNGFALYKTQGTNTNFTRIATLTYSKTKYVDSNLKLDTEYIYRIRAYNDGGNSKWSNIVSVKTPYAVSGHVIGAYGKVLSNVIVTFGNEYKPAKSDLNGHWLKEGLRGIVKIKASKNGWSFVPKDITTKGERKDIDFFGIDMSKKAGALRWKFETEGGIPRGAAIGANGTVYVKSQDDYLYAVNPNGTLKWKFKTGLWVSFDPVVSSDGTVYVVSHHGYLYAINPDGKLKWKFETGSRIESSPAIGSNGTVYVGSGDYLYAINPDGKPKWNFETGSRIESSPAIDSDGTVYFGSDDDYLYAINSHGTLKWKFKTGWDVLSSPAIGLDGTIYVGSDDGHLYAINPNGKLKWKFEIGHFTPVYDPAIGSNNIIYVSGGSNLYVLNPDGTLKWEYKTEGYVSGPTVGLEKTVYVCSQDGYLYAIATDSNGLANSPWPMFQHDVRHTGKR